MQPTTKPREELQRARQALSRCHDAKAYEEFQEHWHEFLGRLERIWSKSESHYKRSPKWDGWKGAFVKLRREDPLLSYLCNARGAEEHTVADITALEAGKLTVSPGPTGVLHVKRMLIDKGRLVHFEGGPDPVIKITPSAARLLPITNRGRTYQPPTKHLGQDIDPAAVVAVGELAAYFYEQFLDKADAEFIK